MARPVQAPARTGNRELDAFSQQVLAAVQGRIEAPPALWVQDAGPQQRTTASWPAGNPTELLPIQVPFFFRLHSYAVGIAVMPATNPVFQLALYRWDFATNETVQPHIMLDRSTVSRSEAKTAVGMHRVRLQSPNDAVLAPGAYVVALHIVSPAGMTLFAAETTVASSTQGRLTRRSTAIHENGVGFHERSRWDQHNATTSTAFMVGLLSQRGDTLIQAAS